MSDQNRKASHHKELSGGKDKKNIWDIYAPVYAAFMNGNRKAYRMMYHRIRKVVKGKHVLELAAGPGLIAKHVADAAEFMIATDASKKMIEQAKKGKNPRNLTYLQADAAHLNFAKNSFDVVIISNALHIIPEPEAVLSEIQRVLKPGGILIAPNFIHKNSYMLSHMMNKALSAAGVAFEVEWDKKEYQEFLEEQGFVIVNQKILKAMFPLMYVELKAR